MWLTRSTVTRRVRPAGSSSGDEGVALIFVIGIIMVMMTLVATSLAYAIATKRPSRHNQDWNAALAAAQAGVDDYVAKLNQADSYSQTVDCTNNALKGPKTGTNSCGWNSSTAPGWQNVQSGNPSAGAFHYDVDTSDFWKNGSIRLNSTGKVNGVSRTMQVRVSRGGSTEFLYYTDFEDADPDNRVSYPNGPGSNACGRSGPTNANYWYEGRSGCSEIQFAGFDVLDGKVHFNDTPLMSNSGGPRPQFLQGYETADPNCTVAAGRPNSSGVATGGSGKCYRSNSSASPYVGTSGAVPAGKLYLPDNSDQFANFPGCVYTGDTRIRFKSDGTMDVWNTGSAGTTLTGPGTPAGTNCGNASSFKPAAGQKYPSAKQNVPVPNDMVIYVKNSTSGSSTCVPGQIVNGTTSGSSSNDVIPLGSGSSVTDVTDISYFDPDRWSSTTSRTWNRVRQGNGSYRWVDAGSSGPSTSISSDDHPNTFDCGLGNVYIEGTLKGRVTIASQNNIVVTGDLSINGASGGSVPAGPDMAGLVAANSVVVYHPVSRSSSTSTNTDQDRSTYYGDCQSASNMDNEPSGGRSQGYSLTCSYSTTKNFGGGYSNLSYPNQTSGSGNRYIYASIQTLQHSFWVQSFNRGNDLGTLSVRGSIAQKWRGAVGTSGGTGYQKDYSYDARLQFSSPPYFPQWTNAVWGAKTTGELKAQY
jgi:Tfp pilus assembly protein PilX